MNYRLDRDEGRKLILGYSDKCVTIASSAEEEHHDRHAAL
jgi:hypothetical protein